MFHISKFKTVFLYNIVLYCSLLTNGNFFKSKWYTGKFIFFLIESKSFNARNWSCRTELSNKKPSRQRQRRWTFAKVTGTFQTAPAAPNIYYAMEARPSHTHAATVLCGMPSSSSAAGRTQSNARTASDLGSHWSTRKEVILLFKNISCLSITLYLDVI